MRRGSLWVGVALVGGATLAVVELPYLNWKPVVPPVDVTPLTIRHDAKGDGRFLSPRSGGRRHRGVDLAAPMHSPVRAIRSGTVVQVGFHRGFGRFVELEHRHPFDFVPRLRSAQSRASDSESRDAQGGVPSGVEGRQRMRSLYAHLDEVAVKAGARVRQGQLLGAVGKTGNARHPWIIPHLHLEVSKRGAPMNPEMLGLQIVGKEPLEPFEDDARGGE